ncbi:hypothetical protein BGX23_004505 [Mortierella sp. AD031]|nr:hypothetical protein BGX23_004505 [Mortierella sp. AD031]
MRTNIAKTTASSLRQDYLQQYLKQFLRRVHPDLFQHHPQEQLQNSASLQDLLPIVGHEKNKGASLSPSHLSSPNEVSKKLAFYYRTKDAGQRSSGAMTPNTPSRPTGGLQLVKHTLPLVIDPRIPSSESDSGANPKQDLLEREVKSWEMVQSFMDLCRKVGVPVKSPDQEDIASHLQESIKKAETATRSNLQKRAAPQKPVSQVFMEELQNSFSGSSGHSGSSSSPLSGESDIQIRSGSSFDTIRDTHLGKIGGTAPALDAQLMIQSNPLLFKGPELSSAKLGKTIRTWIHWQEEDQHLTKDSPSVFEANGQTPFRLGDWWRKVPIMVLSSGEERAEVLKAAEAVPVGERSQSIRGMLIVHQDMSKQDMTEYLAKHLDRIQQEYKEMLQEASPMRATPGQGTVEGTAIGKASVSAEAGLYLERMRARTQRRKQLANKRWQ